jgi:hypothetical protein
LRDVDKHAALKGTFRESITLKRFSIYVALMSSIIDYELSSFQEAAG